MQDKNRNWVSEILRVNTPRKTRSVGTNTDPVTIVYTNGRKRPWMSRLPPGRFELYNMSHVGHDYLLIECGRWPATLSNWYDFIQVNEVLSLESTSELILNLLPFQRAYHIVIILNPRWLDMRSDICVPMPDLVGSMRSLMRRMRTHSSVSRRPRTITMLGQPRKPFPQFKLLEDELRKATDFFVDTRHFLPNATEVALDRGNGVRYELNDHCAAVVLHASMEKVRRLATDLKRRLEVTYQSPLNTCTVSQRN